jgi:hypothetical protein
MDIFNAVSGMNHLGHELKLLLRLVLILFDKLVSIINSQISTCGKLRMKIIQTLRLLAFINWSGNLSFVCIDRVFFTGISSVRLGR